jgi:hypothetical protein
MIRSGWGRPDEGLGLDIGFFEEAIDGGLELDDRSEHAVPEPPVRLTMISDSHASCEPGILKRDLPVRLALSD